MSCIKVFPNFPPQRNLNHNHKDVPEAERQRAVNLFHKACRTPFLPVFERHMEELRDLSPKMHAYVMSKEPKRWAMAHKEISDAYDPTNNAAGEPHV